jgi:hypothetical protein
VLGIEDAAPQVELHLVENQQLAGSLESGEVAAHVGEHQAECVGRGRGRDPDAALLRGEAGAYEGAHDLHLLSMGVEDAADVIAPGEAESTVAEVDEPVHCISPVAPFAGAARGPREARTGAASPRSGARSGARRSRSRGAGGAVG